MDQMERQFVIKPRVLIKHKCSDHSYYLKISTAITSYVFHRREHRSPRGGDTTGEEIKDREVIRDDVTKHANADIV